MTYCLYMRQEGEGCDYTIGCAQKLVYLKANDIRNACQESMKIMSEYGVWYTNSDHKLAEACIVEVIEDLMVAVHQREADEERAERAEELSDKRAQLERLKKELGET